MATRATMIPEESQARSLAELREKLLADKAARRRYLVSAPIPEKLRILEEMRDLTRALKSPAGGKQSARPGRQGGVREIEVRRP